MSEMDRLKWDSKYRDKLLKGIAVSEPCPRLKQLSSYLAGGSALELACGMGENSFYLARKGYRVTAYDVSPVVIDFIRAQAKNFSITAEVMDLDHWSPDLEQYDLVVITKFLDRRLFPIIKSVIKPDGLFFMETFYHSTAMRDEYKLLPNELQERFGEWEILFFEQDPGTGLQSILVRKP
ncbi:class I SAM-dependent methyltransferase [Ammoniphilus resinae]|uniref:SAM-dependent methyltransferase n=1 Tax=Ammoniphilus resinae TaxID=861532 RepID=A0ABS4GLM9_9BACL|nr:methyltransferase domain-containing protein [Ammoniphilus resinae]MBP1931178.1 SAM-dependent methyltransferase [Ammoniphilus resinae]